MLATLSSTVCSAASAPPEPSRLKVSAANGTRRFIGILLELSLQQMRCHKIEAQRAHDQSCGDPQAGFDEVARQRLRARAVDGRLPWLQVKELVAISEKCEGACGEAWFVGRQGREAGDPGTGDAETKE